MDLLEYLFKKREAAKDLEDKVLEDKFSQEINRHLGPMVLDIIQKMQKYGNYSDGIKTKDIRFCIAIAYDIELEQPVLLQVLDYLQAQDKKSK